MFSSVNDFIFCGDPPYEDLSYGNIKMLQMSLNGWQRDSFVSVTIYFDALMYNPTHILIGVVTYIYLGTSIQ